MWKPQWPEQLQRSERPSLWKQTWLCCPGRNTHTFKGLKQEECAGGFLGSRKVQPTRMFCSQDFLDALSSAGIRPCARQTRSFAWEGRPAGAPPSGRVSSWGPEDSLSCGGFRVPLVTEANTHTPGPGGNADCCPHTAEGLTSSGRWITTALRPKGRPAPSAQSQPEGGERQPLADHGATCS